MEDVIQGHDIFGPGVIWIQTLVERPNDVLTGKT